MLSLRKRRVHRVIGLMSGTSADAIDAALVRIRDLESTGGTAVGPQLRAELLAFRSVPHPEPLRARILGAARAGTKELATLHVELGERFGQAAAELAREHGADLVGSHGQTVIHLPPSQQRPAATLQLGCPARIAEASGLPVVADFRARDVACGGEGAPLVPLVDFLLFASGAAPRVLLNLGGIANLTYVPASRARDEVVAYDVGPGNALSDALVRLFRGGGIDEGGAGALRGRVDDALLDRLLEHPFVRRAAPKSADRDAFGDALAEDLRARRPHASLEDLLATAAAFTAECVAREVAILAERHGPPEAVYASGGGVRNEAIATQLRARLAPIALRGSHELGVPEQAKEAVAFAVLARETLLGRPGNLPRVTGASHACVLGSITP